MSLFDKLREEIKRKIQERLNPRNPVPVPKPIKPKEDKK